MSIAVFCEKRGVARSQRRDRRAVSYGWLACAALTLAQSAAAQDTPIEVTVRAESRGDRARKSAQAVTVVETSEQRLEASDMGGVLARSQGTSVQREGGLGSYTRFALSGLTDDQIRFLIDGIPLELAGYPFGFANVPVGFVDRVEIHRGVVPLRLGADALGGAVNLITADEVRGHSGAASYQVGSFGTHRVATKVHHVEEASRWLTRVGFFHDRAENDYAIDAEVPDSSGQPWPVRVKRFHDAYRATGGHVEAGFVRTPWAQRFLLRAFVADYYKELQNNAVMSVPYGEADYGELTRGVSLRYKNTFDSGLALEAIGGYTLNGNRFRDVSHCAYNWRGECVTRPASGEIRSEPHDQRLLDQVGFARVHAGVRLDDDGALSVSVAPTFTTRGGVDRARMPGDRDPLSAQRDLLAIMSGAEYELDALEGLLENVTFAKLYLQSARSEEPVPNRPFRKLSRNTHRLGAGNALRYHLTDSLYAKASYEYATRLPQADELFGDGVLVHDNLTLEPEQSHNGNLSIALDLRETDQGDFRGEAGTFVREVDQLIILTGDHQSFTYKNVHSARSLGIEVQAGWTSPGEYVQLDANLTYVDYRSTSSHGTFGDISGDRIPNRPYLFSNGSAQLRYRKLAFTRDQLSLTWHSRYVHEFFRGWESLGARADKDVIPDQLTHALALTYLITGGAELLALTAEVDNLTDAGTFDFFGVQRPGRSFSFKVSAEL